MFTHSRRNEANSCYCVQGFRCFESGVLNMAPCKVTPERPNGAPLALSYPHFYQADPSYQQQFQVGIQPDPERHQSFFLIEPHTSIPVQVGS